MFKPTHICAFSLGAGLTVLLMLFIGYQLDGEMGFCRFEAATVAAETPVICARSWISALSGWAALFIGLPTLRWLKVQAQATRVQKMLERAEITLKKMDKEDTNFWGCFPIDFHTFETDGELDRTIAKLSNARIVMLEALIFLEETSSSEENGQFILKSRKDLDKLGLVINSLFLFYEKIGIIDPDLDRESVYQNEVEGYKNIPNFYELFKDISAKVDNRANDMRKWQVKNTLPNLP